MDKSYNRINWVNQPSNTTALGATNLNKMDLAMNTLDDRVIVLDTTKAPLGTVNAMVRDFSLNSVNGVITITYQNGTITTYDTKLEKLAVNFSYDAVNQRLVIALDDGTFQYVDISSLITQYEFENSPTIGFTITGGKVKAEIPDGSITDDKLQPNYLADITIQAQTATTQANKSQRYAVGGVEAGDTTDNAKYYKEQAEIARNEAEAIVGFDPITKLNVANQSTSTSGQALISNGDGTSDFKDALAEKIVYGVSNVKAALDTHASELAEKVTQADLSATGRNVKLLFGVLRNTSGTWEFITDTAHQNLNFSGVEVIDNDLQLTYGFTATKVGALVVTPDETLAATKVKVGASVGTTLSNLRFFVPMECTVTGGGTIQYNSTLLDGLISAAAIADGSGITITHPTIIDGVDDIPTICVNVDFASTTRGGDFKIYSISATSIGIQHFAQMGGYINYSGSAWVATTDNINKPTFSYDAATGKLTVTHASDLAPANNYGISLVGRSTYIPIVETVGNSSFVVQFMNSTTGAIVLPADTNMKFFYTRTIKVITTIPSASRFSVKRGMVKIPAANMITGATGNFWVYGAMNI